MRTVLLILFASASALVLAALLGGHGERRLAVARLPSAAASLLAASRLPVPRLPMASIPSPPFPGVRPPAARPAPSRAAAELVALARRPPEAGLADAAAAPSLPGLPLTERSLSQAERGEPITPGLQEAIDRIEPVFDPTRLDGPFVPAAFRIWPGTASMTDVFGEHWRLASLDPNVEARVRSLGLVWLGSGWARSGALPCAAFTRNRPHALGETTLADLGALDCSRLQQRQASRFEDAAPIPVAAAPTGVPVFAAPPPGSRMTSEDFWAAQQARVAAARAFLKRKWQAARSEPDDLGLRR